VDLEWDKLPSPHCSTFKELYLDTSDYTLLQRNWWLRRKGENDWSLKLDVSHNKNTLVYEEIRDVGIIIEKLSTIISVKNPRSPYDFCTKVVSSFFCSRLSYNFYYGCPTVLYFDCIQLSPSQFYFLGTLQNNNINIDLQELLPAFNAVFANSKIVEYLRHGKSDLIPSFIVQHDGSDHGHLKYNPLVAHGATPLPEPRVMSPYHLISYLEEIPFEEVDVDEEDDDDCPW